MVWHALQSLLFMMEKPSGNIAVGTVYSIDNLIFERSITASSLSVTFTSYSNGLPGQKNDLLPGELINTFGSSLPTMILMVSVDCSPALSRIVRTALYFPGVR